MIDTSQKKTELGRLVRQLIADTGITEAQALELILLLGTNWSSLMRGPKALKRRE